MENKSSEKEEIPQKEFFENIELNFESENENNNNYQNMDSLNIINYKPNILSINLRHSFKVDIPSLSEWKMNLIEIEKEKDLLFFSAGKKIYSLKLQLSSFTKQVIYKKHSSLKLIYEGEEVFNQIKLIQNEENSKNYLLCVDMKGLLYKLDLHDNNVEKYDCKNQDSQDNSCWSLDGKYPYAAVGGNHHKIKLHNLIEKPEIPLNYTLSYNKHNVPCVSFSPCGNFILSSSIDKHARIIDFYTGKLIKEFYCDSEWGWCVKMCLKRSFSSSLMKKSDYLEPPSHMDIQNIISIFPESIYIDDLDSPTETIEENTDESNFSSENILYEQQTLKNCLEKYILFYTTQYCLYVWDPSKDLNIKHKTKNNLLGKVNLLRNYLKTVFTEIQNINYATIYQTKYYIANSRYDNIFICNSVSLLMVSNRAGDIQIYDLCLKIIDLEDAASNMVPRFNKDPLAIIKCKNIIAGIRVIEDKRSVKLIVLQIDKTIEIYQINRQICNGIGRVKFIDEIN